MYWMKDRAQQRKRKQGQRVNIKNGWVEKSKQANQTNQTQGNQTKPKVTKPNQTHDFVSCAGTALSSRKKKRDHREQEPRPEPAFVEPDHSPAVAADADSSLVREAERCANSDMLLDIQEPSDEIETTHLNEAPAELELEEAHADETPAELPADPQVRRDPRSDPHNAERGRSWLNWSTD